MRSGKVRYIGFSDTPAWRVAQAQTLAHFRGYAPLIALQIEYSLLERTVEGELIPAAQELGLGVTPWSPLKSGALSGKYTRENAGQQKGDRGFMVDSRARRQGVRDRRRARSHRPGDREHARERRPRVGAGRPGVTSTIIGARTVEQLDQNLAALSVKLAPAQVQRLDALSTPQLGFPMAFLSRAGSFMHGGITVNGDAAPPSPFAPKVDSPRF